MSAYLVFLESLEEDLPPQFDHGRIGLNGFFEAFHSRNVLECVSSICDTTQEALDVFIVDCTASWKPSVVGTLEGRHCSFERVRQ